MARAAVTLTEMLVVVAIIVVLAGIGGTILLPRLDAAKEDADRVKATHIAEAATLYMTNSGDSSTVPAAQQLASSDGTQGGNARPLLKRDDVLDRNGHEFQIREGRRWQHRRQEYDTRQGWAVDRQLEKGIAAAAIVYLVVPREKAGFASLLARSKPAFSPQTDGRPR